MRYVLGEPTSVTFDRPLELQALTWAASEMRASNPDDKDFNAAYKLASHAVEVSDPSLGNVDVLFEGQEAQTVLSVIRRWVAQGLPEAKGQATDGARTRSYITAQWIMAATIEHPQK